MASDRENLMPAFCRKPKAKSQKPKAKSQKPKAKSQKPKAKSQKPEHITEQDLPLCEEVTC